MFTKLKNPVVRNKQIRMKILLNNTINILNFLDDKLSIISIGNIRTGLLYKNEFYFCWRPLKYVSACLYLGLVVLGICYYSLYICSKDKNSLRVSGRNWL